MTRDTLREYGLTDEQIDKVWSGLDGNYIPKSRFNEINAKKNQLEEQLRDRDEQLEKLKTQGEATEKLKQQISELQTANAEKEKAHAVELKRLKRENFDDRLLNEAGAIDPLAVKPFLPAIDDGVDDDGYAVLRKQQIDALTKTESKKFLFKPAQETTFVGVKPAESGDTAPPVNGGVNPFDQKTYDEAAQIRLFRENPDLARVLAKQAGIRIN